MIEKELSLDDLPPTLQMVLDYWRGLGGETLACDWRRFELDKLPPVILPTTLVVDVMPDITRNRFRFWGTGMTRIHGVDMTGRTTAELEPPDLAEAVCKTHEHTVTTQSPSASVFGFQRFGGFDHLQRLLRMPLSDDGVQVTQIVVVIDLTAEGRAEIDRKQAEPASVY